MVVFMINKKGGIDYLKEKFGDQPIDTISYENVFYKMRKDLFAVMPKDSGDIIFVGNSITANCDWAELFKINTIKNRGIGGDVIEGVVHRLPEILSGKPAKIFMEIGTNDLELQHSVERIVSDYEKMVQLIRTSSPTTRLYVESILPTFKDPYRANKNIQLINSSLNEISEKNGAIYINLFDLLKNSNNELDIQYSLDGLHLNAKGYLILKKELEKYLHN